MPISGPPVGSDLLTNFEIYNKDHRNQNGYTKIDNELLQYSLHPGDAAPAVEVHDGASSWVAVGGIQLMSWSGSAYTVLPLREYNLITISPEEVIWREFRYDSGGVGLVAVTGRIRRGSRLISLQIVSASGQGLTGPLSISLVGPMASTLASLTASADNTGVVMTSASNTYVPGWMYLDGSASTASSVNNTTLSSGLIVPAGTVKRIALLAGWKDGQYGALGSTLAAYAAKWASINRTRVKQTLLIGGS